MTIFRFFAALFWSSWFMWASYSFLLELFGGAEEAFPEQAICASRKEKRVSSPWGQAFWAGMLWQDSLSLGDGEQSPKLSSCYGGPSFQDPTPFTSVPCYLVCLGEGGLSQVWRGMGMWFPRLLTVCRPPHHTPRLVLLGLPSVVKEMRLPRALSVAWGKALGYLLLLNPGL